MPRPAPEGGPRDQRATFKTNERERDEMARKRLPGEAQTEMIRRAIKALPDAPQSDWPKVRQGRCLKVAEEMGRLSVAVQALIETVADPENDDRDATDRRVEAQVVIHALSARLDELTWPEGAALFEGEDPGDDGLLDYEEED